MSELTDATIAVTGATGFLGRYICAVLLDRGAEVIGVVRRPDRVPQLLEQGVQMRRADLLDRASLEAGFAGADAVVSNAALFRIGQRDWEALHEANVRGTRNVFEAASAAGVGRIVHVSSTAVYADRRGPRLTEESPKLVEDDRNPFNGYQVSKALSEALAWELAEELGLELTTVRPGPIYGAHDPNFTPWLRRLFGLPVAVVPAFLSLPFVYAGDVAEAIALALENHESVGQAYNTAGEADATLWDLADAWAEAGGRVGRLRLPLPAPVRIRVDNGRAYDELGWRNRPLVRGLRETFAEEPELAR